MKEFFGNTNVIAKPMARGDYNTYRGWTIPADEDPTDEGFLVQHLGSGLEQWMPKATFLELFRQSGNLTFGMALESLKRGKKVSRSGWNGNGMFLFIVPGSVFKVNRPPLLGIYEEGTEINYHAHIDMKTADGMVVPWLCSQTDALAEDWEILE